MRHNIREEGHTDIQTW